MKYAAALSALAAATFVSAQVPGGCSSDYSGYFEYNPVPLTAKLSTPSAPTTCTSEPYSTLKGGVLTDQCERTGSIVANNQFQYDLNVQNNAINTGGFSVCGNGTLAVAGSAVFYHCLSGSFYNLYDANVAAQCSPVFLEVIPCTPPSDAGSDCPAGTPNSPPSVTPSPSGTSSTSATPSTLSTAAAPAVTSAAVSSAVAPAILAVSMPYSYPSSNTTTSATATGTVAPVSTATSTAKTSPIPFQGGAASVAMGGKLLVAAVGIVAMAVLA